MTDTTAPTDGSCIDGNLTGATPDVGNGSCVSNGAGAPNVWFSFIANGMDYDISAPGLGGSVEITLIQFLGIPCTFGAATEIDCGIGNIVGNNVLVPGQQYYVSITSSNGSVGPFSLCVDNPVDPPAPPNDEPCSPTPVPGNGSCTTGTTVNATQEWSNPNCPNLGQASVWYSITLGPNSNSVDITLGNQTISGDASMMIGTFSPDCSGGFGFVEQYCGPPSTTITASGLTPGSTYWIVISTADADAGMFDICVTENGPPPACAAIDNCSGAQDISTPAGTNNCVTGCNTGTSPDVTGGGGCFDFSSIPTVWFTFTTDANTDFVNLNLNSPEFDLPQIAVFQGSCAAAAQISCSQGAGGSVALQQVDVMPNTTYFIAVGSIGGQDGNFNLCMTTVPSGGTNCNVGTQFNVTNTSMGSPPSGPFQAGEQVTICIDVSYSSASNNCQWIHGVVPEFGDCWDPTSFGPNGAPLNATLPGGATWSWFNDGDVYYNDVPGGVFGQGDPVGAGWFVTGVAPNPVPVWCNPGDQAFDPNCSWGSPMGCGTQQVFQFCVTLTTKMYPECDAAPENINCGITIRAFGDGETGGWVQTGCQLDVPWSSNYSLNCCDPPDMLPLPATACSDAQIDIFLDDYLLPPAMSGDVTYTWTVSAPAGVTGASPCPGGCGNILSQILVNTTSSPQIVTYTITPRTIDGCLGLPVNLQITVLPSVDAMIQNPTGALCSGNCALLFGNATGGIPPYSYEWSTGDVGISTEVCPTFTTTYFLTVTDGNDCTGVEQITVQANPNLNVTIVANPNILEMCESDPQFPIQLTAFADIGGPAWFYNWELANGATPSIPFVQATSSGTYCVTLTDANGCEGEDCIDIIIHPAPTLILFPVGPLCQGGPAVGLNVVTIPAGGTGSWSSPYLDGNGDFDPTTPGNHQVCYDFVDDNGCPATECMFIQVDPVPGPPTFSTFEPTVCADGTNITYCVDPVADATTYNWTFPAGVTITSGAGTTCVTVDWNGAASGDVCVTASNTCGASAPTCQAVTVGSAPAPPADLAGPLTPCVNQTGLVYSISAVAGATGYTWNVTGGTITAGAGTTSITVTWGTASGTVCVTADNSCGSSAPACINIDPIDIPAAPAAISDPGAVCAGDNNVVYSIAAVPGATTYNWTVPAGATFTGNGTTSITVDWGTSTGGQICVNAENTCGNSADVCITITPGLPPNLAGPVLGPNTVCANANGVGYAVGSASGATGYTWTITGGTQATGGSTNAITVNWGAGPSGQVCVTADNACGSSAPVCINVTINNAPPAPTPPAEDTVCEGASGDTYSVAAVPGATSYNWTVPAPATFTGQGTSSINIDWGTSTGVVTVCVNAENTCGISPDACFNITLDPVPNQPGAISGPLAPCSGSTGIVYSIAAVPGATSYNWTVPTGATIASGQGSTSITVNWGLSSGGQICVNAQNSCGTSINQCITVTPFGPPVLTGPINGLNTLCANTLGVSYAIADAPGATAYNWVITGGTQASGGTGSSITVDWGAGPTGQVCVTAENACGNSAPICLNVTIGQVPAAPLQLQDQTICAGAVNQTYSVPPVPGATSYNWTFPPLATVSGQGTNSVSVNWNGATSGTVCVNAENSCGTSADACFNVTIETPPPAPTGLNGNDLLCQNTTGETYSIDPVTGATSYVWTVGGSGTITSGQGSTSIQVNWGNAGGDVCVYAVNNCGDGPEVCLPVTIELILAPPSISCGASTTNSVIFNWSHPTATQFSYTYTINGGAPIGPITTSNNTVTIGSLTANDAVVITMIALGGNNVCGDSQPATQDCNANDCTLNPPTFTNVLPEYCVNETGIVFQATPAGGVFSGPGVASDGSFDPSGLPAGPVLITYEYIDANNCPQSADVSTTIVLPIVPPQITCNGATSSSVSFAWTHPSATMFEYYYSVNGGPLTATTATNLNDLTISMLMEGDMVELFVIAIGPLPCGNSIAGSRVCNVEICPNTPPLINGINDPYCENDNSVIVFTGVPNTGTFSGMGIDPDGTFHPNTLPVGLNPITYSYIDNIGCTQSATVDIEIVGILTPPDVSCGLSTQSSVTFNWFHPDPAVTEFIYSIGINGPPVSSPVTTTDQTLEITGLTANDVVTISVIAVGINACGNSAATIIDCTADDCQNNPPSVAIDPQYCITDAPVQLVASAGSGTYTGSAGVSSSGLFNPANAGVGIATITYSYVDPFNCDQMVTVNTEVVDIIPAPQVSCQGSTTDAVTFGITSSATDFEYTYTINGGSIQGPFTTNTTSINITGLSVNDIVDISVIAIGPPPCGNSAPGTASCQAQDCPDTPPTILNVVPEYCITETGILLMASPSGGTFSVDGTPIAGAFNPADFSVGPHTIGYTYTDMNGCPQSTSVSTTIVGPPAGPVVTCQSSTTNTVTFSWPAYPGATGYSYTYTVNGGAVQGPFTTNNTDVTIPGLSVNDIVDISVIATGLMPCNESLEGTASCQAQDCPVNPPTILNVAPEYCITETGIMLMANPTGGTFSVDGTPIAGAFNPADFSVGPHTIGYTYIDMDGCSQSTSVVTTIVSPPQGPAVTCQSSTTNSVTFGWPAYPGATGYTYYYTIDNGAVVGPFTTVNTDVTINGLTVNQVVDITVIATGLSPCNESLESMAQCVAKDCVLQVSIGSAPDFCLDGSQSTFQLTVTVTGSNGSGNGFWSGSCLTGPNNDIFDPNACASAGIQNVSYTFEEDGCTQVDILQINVFDAPLAEAGTSVALTCSDPEKELNGVGSTTSPGTAYLWTGPGTIVNETTLTPTVNAIGMFTLTVTSAQGCTATDQVMVTQDGDLPVVTPGPDQTLTCIVDKVTLSATSVPATDISYLWVGPGITPANETDASPEVDQPGEYFVIVWNDLNGCSSIPVYVNVIENRDPIEVIIVNPLDTINCYQTQLTFDLCNSPAGVDNTNYTYEWFYQGIPLPNGDTCSIMVETPGGIFTYVVTDTVSGCVLNGQVEALDLIAVPLADAGDDAELDCNTTMVTLQGSNTQTGPGITYEWSGPPGGISGPNDGISVNAVLPGTYLIEVTDNNIGCVNTSSAEVTANQNAPQADAGSDRELDCDFTPVDLNGSATSGVGSIAYQWLDPAGTTVGQSVIVSVNEAGTYTLAVEDIDNGCVDTAYVDVRLNENVPQDAVIDIKDPTCFGDTDGYINMVDIIGGTPPFNYSFNGATYSNTSFITNLAPGVYHVAIEDAAGCGWETDILIDSPAEIGFNLGDDLDLEMGEDGIIQATTNLNSDEIDSIYWNPYTLVECIADDCLDVLLQQMDQTTTISATVVDTNNCKATDEILVKVKKDRLIYIPSGFSPNNDGTNDFFFIHGGRGVAQIDYFQVFDRWGEMVFSDANFQPNDPIRGWDGSLKGEPLNPAVFVYYAKVTFIDGFVQEYKGDVTLVR